MKERGTWSLEQGVGRQCSGGGRRSSVSCTVRTSPANRHLAAFTLIELLVVIAIIAILAALALSTLGYVNKKGAESRAQSEVAALSAAIESYKLDFGTYPSDSAALFRELTGSGGAGAVNTNKVYFEPQPGMTNTATGPFLDPWGTAYGYSNFTTYFELWSTAGGANTNSWIRN